MEASMSTVEAGASSYGLERGDPQFRSIGPIAFGPEGILFVADNANAAIVALGLREDAAPADQAPPGIEHLDTRLAAFLGCAAEDVHIRDLAVSPVSGEAYLAVLRGGGASAVPVLVKIGADSTIAEVPVDDVPFARIAVQDAPSPEDARQELMVVPPGEPEDEVMEVHGITLHISRQPLRTSTVTDLVYVDGKLLIAGASNEEFTSSLRVVAFPFDDEVRTSAVEIFHVSHGKYETHSPIRTFVPYQGGTSVLASYTCTPVVHFSVDELVGGERVVGRTVAELGAMNTPLDMVSYTSDGEEYLLVSNSRHPLLKLACREIDAQEPLTTPQEPVGVPSQSLPHEGVSRMASVDGHVLMLQRDASGGLNLRSYASSSL
jgi:hypothetical protein